MVMQTNDPTYGASDREIDWAYGNIQWPKWTEIQTSVHRRAKLKEYAAETEDKADEVRKRLQQSKSHLVDETYFEWLKNNDSRFIPWLKIYFFRFRRNGSITSIDKPAAIKNASKLSAEEYHLAFIKNVDLWSADIKTKKDFFDQIKFQWYSQQKQDKKLKWIDINNEVQIDWIWEYLDKTPFGSGLLNPQIRGFNPTNRQEKYTCIFEWFYSWTRHPAELTEYQKKIKQAWTQLRYRTNLKQNNKKQSTYALSEKATDQLKFLAAFINVNRNQMLEYIIGEAYKNLKTMKKPKHPEQDSDLQL